jgi:lathosterol oxidase
MRENFPFLYPLVLNLIRYIFFIGTPFLIFYILFPDAFQQNKIQQRIARHKDFIREALHSLQTIFIIAGIAFLVLQTPFKSITQFYTDIHTFPLWWIPVSIVLAMLLHDAYFYWLHRFIHHPKIYRKVHFVHHQSTNPSPLAAYSFQFTEGVLEALVGPIILVLIPMHPLAFVIYIMTILTMNVYGHLGYEIAPRWFRHSFLFEIINSSVHHNMHHEKFKGNYGLYFRIWDRLMGTEHPDYVKEYDKIQERRFGPFLQGVIVQ